jgi:hypothetical protein
MNFDDIITVRIQNNYGNKVIYPVCKHAMTFADIAGTKTLTESTLKLIEKLGYKVMTESQTAQVIH